MSSLFLRFASVVGALAVSLWASPAAAVILTFEELPHGEELQGAGPTVMSKGYTLQYAAAPDEPFPLGFTVVGPSWRFNGRSAALAANSCSATTTLTADDNNPLTMVSIDLAGLNGDIRMLVTFVGITSEGATVQQTFQLAEDPGWQRAFFSSAFRRLRSVTWTQGDCTTTPPHMFDNVFVFPSWKGRGDE